MKKGLYHNALILLIITLVSGLLLSFVYEITKNPIKEAEQNAKTKAYSSVLKASNYKSIKDIEMLIEKVNKDFQNGKQDENGISFKRTMINEALSAVDENDRVIGYVLTVTSKDGYGGNIQVAYGISGFDFSITGFEVLSQSETAGFGAKCVEESYKSSFKGDKSIDDVDIITGATYTTTAIKETIGAGICFVKDYLDKEGI